MDWNTIQGVLTGVFAVTTLVAAAFAGLQIGTTRTLRESNSDLRARVTDLEHGRETDRTEKAEIVGKLDTVQAENKLLKSMVQGRVEWAAISDQLGHVAEVIVKHDQKAEAFWSRAEEHLTDLIGQNGGAS